MTLIKTRGSRVFSDQVAIKPTPLLEFLFALWLGLSWSNSLPPMVSDSLFKRQVEKVGKEVRKKTKETPLLRNIPNPQRCLTSFKNLQV